MSVWENDLEAHGAAFLPYTGFRAGTTYYTVSAGGGYWTSSYCGGYYAYNVGFGDSSFSADSFGNRYSGFAVRLVAPIRVITASVNPSDGGTVTGMGTYMQGQSCTLTATANEGYTFVNWTENGEEVSAETTYSFIVTGERAFIANFELNSYEVTVTANPAEGGAVSGGGMYSHGSNCTLTATANEGYTFVNWTKNGEEISTSATYSFTVTEAGSYVANFELNSYDITVTANPAEGGTVTGAGIYNHGETATLTATANEGYTFTNWKEGGQTVSTEATYSFTVNGDRTRVSNFAAEGGEYHWTPNDGPYVNTSIVIGIIQIEGEEQTLTTLEVGAFCGEECRGREKPRYVSQLDRYILFMTLYGNDGDEMTFRLYDHTINQELNLTCSSVVTFAANNTIGSPANPYVLNFEGGATTYAIMATANPAEGGTVTGSGTYTEGSSCTLVATANEGYTFVNWTKNGQEVSTSATYSFTVTEAGSYVANFSLNSYNITATANPAEGGTVTTERFMRTPQENPDGYAVNPSVRAERMHGHLLICHGLADDNVHPQNTFEYSEALVQADKDFREIIYTNRNHSIYGANTRQHLLRQIAQFFNDNLNDR